jgi:threonine aldolase
VFPELPEAVANKVMADYRFYVWNQATGQVRWMCSWDTTQEDVDGILTALEKAL